MFGLLVDFTNRSPATIVALGFRIATIASEVFIRDRSPRFGRLKNFAPCVVFKLYNRQFPKKTSLPRIASTSFVLAKSLRIVLYCGRSLLWDLFLKVCHLFQLVRRIVCFRQSSRKIVSVAKECRRRIIILETRGIGLCSPR